MAIRRRFDRATQQYKDPYLPKFSSLSLSPSRSHLAEIRDVIPALSWGNAEISDPKEWQYAARTKLAGLLGYFPDRQAVLAHHQTDYYLPSEIIRRRIYLQTQLNVDIPVNLIWRQRPGRYPVMLCLQGTLAGANRSWGESLVPADPIKITNGADYALQAVERGYLAVCIEQSCYGERQERENPLNPQDPTFAAAIRALQLGHTLLGERVADVARVIDWLLVAGVGDKALPGKIDRARINVMGNSLGGMTAMLATALDQRINGVIAASCVSTFASMISHAPHGPDYVIPGILRWLECADVIALVAPRPFVTVSGVNDHIFPFCDVSPVVSRAREVYSELGATNFIKALSAKGGHKFYPNIAWPAFEDLIIPEAQ